MFNELVNFVINSIDVYILILARVIGIMFIAPMFSRNNIPATVKVGFSMIISYIILPFFVSKVDIDVGSSEFIFLILKETFTGFCIGLCSILIFTIFSAAGANADINIGLSMSQVIDTSTGSNITLTGQMFNSFSFLIFLVINGHHLLIKAIVNSFELLPINSINVYSDAFVSFVIKMYGYILISSVLMVMPIIIILFLGNIVLAFMSKIMPQMNVFIVGMPFKIIVGFIVFYITLSGVKDVVIDIFKKMMEFIYLIINVL